MGSRKEALSMKKVAIVGCGLIGQKRANAIQGLSQVASVFDVNRSSAQAMAAKHNAKVAESLDEVLADPEISCVVVATTHNNLAPTATLAARAGKHVLLEKPGARRPAELNELFEVAASRNIKVQVGFNHRFHPAMQKAKEILDSGALGKLMFIRGMYGHGGRIGYDKEWRAQPEVSGGGELLDQGAHLIDLTHWYLGESLQNVHGVLKTYFWNMPVEDNAFVVGETGTGKTALLHVTWTEWKNTFSFEITGSKGKLHITGLGGSYGTERIAFYQMLPEMGPPPTTIWEYPGADLSWRHEWEVFLQQIEGKDVSGPSVSSTIEVLKVIENLYQSKKG